jgi:hypothetical protein
MNLDELIVYDFSIARWWSQAGRVCWLGGRVALVGCNANVVILMRPKLTKVIGVFHIVKGAQCVCGDVLNRDFPSR